MKAGHIKSFAFSSAMAICLFSHGFVHADSGPYSDSILGPLGLNTTPNARMDQQGTIKAGLSTLDPYLHGYIGIQLADPLYVQLRQSAETSDLKGDTSALYPGLDLKLRLMKETSHMPEISVGMHAAIGERRMGGEYLVASKRYKDFDISAGLGWGGMALPGISAIHFHFWAAITAADEI